MSTRVALADLGADAPTYTNGAPAGHVACLDWRTGAVQLIEGSSSGFDVELDAKGWDLRVLAPLVCEGRLAVFGDGDRYATAGRQRISSAVEHGDGLRLRVAGADEPVRLVGWSSASQVRATVRAPRVGEGAGDAPEELTATVDETGRWELTLRLPIEPGWVQVDLTV